MITRVLDLGGAWITRIAWILGRARVAGIAGVFRGLGHIGLLEYGQRHQHGGAESPNQGESRHNMHRTLDESFHFNLLKCKLADRVGSLVFHPWG